MLSVGGHLVTITSAEEQTFVETYMSANSFTKYAWIGAYSNGTNWKWITDEEYSYTNWDPGEPNCSEGVEFFALINWEKFGNWNDYAPVVHKLALICEWEAE